MGVNHNILNAETVQGGKGVFNSYAKKVTGNATKDASTISVPLKSNRHGSGKSGSIK